MCGIAGMVSLTFEAVSVDRLRAMNATLVHRGPDQSGEWCEGGVGLAMRRLSIIGLANGQQPIFNEDGDVVLVMNGEIYNFRELRAELVAAGHRFATDSDVEVAVHLYEERGADFVDRLRGMFAFALYDRRRRLLLLGRDRAGKKPLYYAAHRGMLLFGSEIKALHASGLLPKGLDSHALDSYLAHGFVVGERTLFEGVSKLPAGFVLAASPAGLDLRRYWDVPAPVSAAAEFDTEASQVRTLLEEAVRVRLMSEVPLGAFLSGGIDSSAIVGIMSRELEQPVETFAVGFESSELDELTYAKAVAQHFGTTHREVIVSDCDADLLRDVNWHSDEPAADPANVPTYCLAKFARQHVTVVLTGEGGDEIFGGYRHYVLHRRLLALEDGLVGVRTVARWAERLEPYAGHLGPRRLWKGIWIANLPRGDRPRGWLSVFTDWDIDRLVAPDLRQTNGKTRIDEFRLLQERASERDWVAQPMYVDTRSQLPEQLLMKVDKMTMAAALEARCPFLDQRLLDYVATLPTRMKISRAGSKLLLRQALRGLVPDEVLTRRKHGFEVPIRRWLLGTLAPVVGDLLLATKSPVSHYLQVGFVRAMWKRLHERADHQLARQLWLLLNFAIWHDQHWPAVRPQAEPCAEEAGR